MSKTLELYARAKRRIPGGTQLLSKRPELFLPDLWPTYYARAHGTEIEDLEGRKFIDMSTMGIGACVLGYSDPDVDRAVGEAIARGSQCSLNAPEEVELADLLCELHPWADMVRYARAGGEAMSVAVRIARAKTGRDKIAFCGYHGWSDWYLAANLAEDRLDGHLMPGLDPAGVPRGLIGSSVPFHYNRLDELQAIIDRNRGEVAAIVLEPRRNDPPAPGFLQAVRSMASDIGAVLIFDEITSGFRATCGGIHRTLGVDPDIAVFAKAMANGYAMAAVIGRESVMQAAQSTFISSTNWTERIGPTAALATIKKYRRLSVERHLEKIGAMMMEIWRGGAKAAGLDVHVGDLPCLAHFEIRHPDELVLMTLFTQLLVERGYLAFSQFKPSLAHDEKQLGAYKPHLEEAFAQVARAAAEGNAKVRLRSAPARRGFYRLT